MFSSIGSISEGWSPIAEISTYIAFLSAGFQVNILETRRQKNKTVLIEPGKTIMKIKSNTLLKI